MTVHAILLHWPFICDAMHTEQKYICRSILYREKHKHNVLITTSYLYKCYILILQWLKNCVCQWMKSGIQCCHSSDRSRHISVAMMLVLPVYLWVCQSAHLYAYHVEFYFAALSRHSFFYYYMYTTDQRGGRRASGYKKLKNLYCRENYTESEKNCISTPKEYCIGKV